MMPTGKSVSFGRRKWYCMNITLPHLLQWPLFAISLEWYSTSVSWCVNFRAEILALAHVQGTPDILQQVRQWHCVNVLGSSVPVNRTDPHWQLAVKRVSASLVPLMLF